MVSQPATGEFLGAKELQSHLMVAPHAPLLVGPNSPLSQRYGSAIITQGGVCQSWAVSAQTDFWHKKSKIDPSTGPYKNRDGQTDPLSFK